ncbi:MAG: ribonuclease H-like domain-containing protein [Acidobacteria bacterium]|nr:ribonuclease H-like domain-containing protein [Acidobacteriota bacterium]
MSSLSDRIRGIVTPGAPGPKGPGLHRQADVGRVLSDPPDLERILCGEWRADAGRRCFIVERRWEPSARHGRDEIGAMAERLDEAASGAPLFANGTPARAPFVFFDLETTGLSGGAGTQAFLVGCAWCEDDGAFVTRQYVLTRYADERPLLDTVAGEFTRAGALVSFNGKSFDAPVLETRYLFHRLAWIGAGVPHVDVLHPARQFWKGESCSLVALERDVLGFHRIGDVAGFEIPERYFQFVRSGDARPLAAVLEHNRLDLLSLAALTSRLLHLARVGPGETRDAREALALGRVYARAGRDDCARAAFELAVERGMSDRFRNSDDVRDIRLGALRAFALSLRRAREYARAAVCWREILDTPGCPPLPAKDAAEALAIHHEHRARDLAAARAFALRIGQAGVPGMPGMNAAVRHRLARLDRKLETATARQPSLSWPSPSLPTSRPSSGSPTSAPRTSS